MERGECRNGTLLPHACTLRSRAQNRVLSNFENCDRAGPDWSQRQWGLRHGRAVTAIKHTSFEPVTLELDVKVRKV